MTLLEYKLLMGRIHLFSYLGKGCVYKHTLKTSSGGFEKMAEE